MAERISDTQAAEQRAARKSLLAVAGVFVVLVLAGPLIFLGLTSDATSGFFGFVSENVWVTVPILLIVVSVVWLPILWLGSRMDRRYLAHKQDENAFSKDGKNG